MEPTGREISATDQEEIDASKAPLMAHLIELRDRIKAGVLGFLPCLIFGLIFYELFYDILTAPLYTALETLKLESAVKFRTVQGVMLFQIKSGIFAGFFLSTPWLLYQLWLFVAPGLYRHERRLVIPFVVMTSAFFFAGALFCYHMVLPFAFEFLLSYARAEGPRQLLPDITLEDYLSFIMRILFAFALVFETPIVLGFFTWIGLTTYNGLLRFWRWAVLLSFVVAALLTPPDYVTQILLALPLVSFYGLSVVFAWIIERRRERPEQHQG